MFNEFRAAISGQARLHMRAEGLADGVRVLVKHQAEGYFRRCLGRNDGLETITLIAAAHAVDFASRARPYHFQGIPTLLTGWLR